MPARRFRHKIRRPTECPLCKEGGDIDYKDILKLRRFITDRGKILPRTKTGICAKHQRKLALEIKKARIMALLPFTEQHAL